MQPIGWNIIQTKTLSFWRHEIMQDIKNIGWTLGNDCPYRCPHCYSTIVRNKGRNMTIADVDRIVSELVSINVETVNLGGNEPIFTNGTQVRDSILPYIIESLHQAGIAVGLTTAGITLTSLQKFFPYCVPLLNDVDVSLDSPFEAEHNKNRGAALFQLALKAVEICKNHDIDRTFIMCGMQWNLSRNHLDGLIGLAKKHDALIRINFMKPTEAKHMLLVPDEKMFYETCDYMFQKCDVVELGEPLASTASGNPREKGCPCGISSFRIHSITPDGVIPVSPCVYAHDYKTGNLLTDSLSDIIKSEPFREFCKRRETPETIGGCSGCEFLKKCRGGCASRAHLYSKFQKDGIPFSDAKDPYCLRDYTGDSTIANANMVKQDLVLVHKDYLCTIIVDPK
jgi:radical SAM protein with 4Fe4S-binding SPASM domain